MNDFRKKVELDSPYRVSAANDSAQEELSDALVALRGTIRELNQEDGEGVKEFFSEEQFQTVLEVGLLQISTREALQNVKDIDKVNGLSDLLFDDDSLAKALPPEADSKFQYGYLATLTFVVLASASLVFLTQKNNDIKILFMAAVGFLFACGSLKSVHSNRKRILEQLNGQDVVISAEVKDFTELGFEIQERLKHIKGLSKRSAEKEGFQREAASLIRQARQQIAENKELFQMKNAEYQRLQASEIESIQTSGQTRFEDGATDEDLNEEQLAELELSAEAELENESPLLVKRKK